MYRIEQIGSLREKLHACGHMARFVEGLSGLRIAEHNPNRANENHYGGNGHQDRRTQEWAYAQRQSSGREADYHRIPCRNLVERCSSAADCGNFPASYVAFFLTSVDSVSFCGSFFMDCFSASFSRALL